MSIILIRRGAIATKRVLAATGLHWADTFTRPDTPVGEVGEPEIVPDGYTEAWESTHWGVINEEITTADFVGDSAEWVILRDDAFTHSGQFQAKWRSISRSDYNRVGTYWRFGVGYNTALGGTPYIHTLWYSTSNQYGSQYENLMNISIRHPDGNEGVFSKQIVGDVVLRVVQNNDNLKVYVDYGSGEVLEGDITSYKIADIVGTGFYFGAVSPGSNDLPPGEVRNDDWSQGEV